MSNLQSQLKALHDSYAAQLPEKIEQMGNLLKALQDSKTNGEILKTLHSLIHKFTGAGATFGFPSLSDTARELEIYLQNLIETNIALTEKHITQINKLFADLKEAINKSKQPELSTNEQKMQNLEIYSNVEQASCLLKKHKQKDYLQKQDNNKLIFIVDDDLDFAKYLALQLENFGYTIQTFNHLTDFEEAVCDATPAVVIMDIIFPESPLAGTEIISRIRNAPKCEIPVNVIFISARNDVIARMEAVRAGASAYFAKPINIYALIDKLEELTNRNVPELYRILIVDDEVELANLWSAILQQANMLTKALSNPMEIMQVLDNFKPDLILMDLYMHTCSGIELAAVVRQENHYVGIPIVFLSFETSIDKQQEALEIGGDDFLTKSIKPKHLISAVTSRVERARLLRSFMMRDSLTNLLNHTTIKEYLNIAVAHSKRDKYLLAFAMIDIDNFKLVNDTYGHPTGDRVLKSLAQMLQQRLRKSDVAGRYGGEEFAVILSDIDIVDAVKLLDELRLSFSQIRHQSETNYFYVTFSCGVAALSDKYNSAVELNNAADNALYKAKQKGKNCVAAAD